MRPECNIPTRQINPNQKARNPKSKILVERYRNTLGINTDNTKYTREGRLTRHR